ncbi:RNA polymerase sigma factor RpoH [Hafnia alvei]|uniref:RNA polymerase sigma factor RpoH n=1 Tax=Hafnia alvei TaxID=569 RepID=UPI000694745E|nr:RNA polymerase sigma factor RpoH [Hafnia alvei]ANC42878.1 RNA polymerase factor sigma-32 [Hafnia alvei]MDU7483979.1 RNA polymerase sigma factor RpoH [Hafnia alvei]TBL89255.1 RNA polymerase sigma factor RpoH [Hafnia alvei]
MCILNGELFVKNYDSLYLYMNTIKSYPRLSADEERALVEEAYSHGDSYAIKRLVLSHLRFVVYIAKDYKGYHLPLIDLIQEGNLGLMKAIDRFDPKLGIRLASFAIHWIKAAIHEYVLRNWRIIKVVTKRSHRKLFFNLRKSQQHLGWMTKDEVDIISKKLEVPEQDVIDMELRLAAADMAFETGSHDDNVLILSPYLHDRNSDFASDIEANDWKKYLLHKLGSAMNDLDKRSQHIIHSRWLNDKKLTLHELAKEYGVSAERIRQLENKALRKLRVSIEND